MKNVAINANAVAELGFRVPADALLLWKTSTFQFFGANDQNCGGTPDTFASRRGNGSEIGG